MKRNHSSRRGFLQVSAAALGAAAFGRPLILLGGEAGSTAANSKLNLAVVGCGGQGRGVMRGLLSRGANLTALCDPDAGQIDGGRADALQFGWRGDEGRQGVRGLPQIGRQRGELRRRVDRHAGPLARPAVQDVHEARQARLLREAVDAQRCRSPRTPRAPADREGRHPDGQPGQRQRIPRRCTEIIKAGALGQIREIYEWDIGVTASEGSAVGEDPVPPGFNWDLWVGPSAPRPYKRDVYHPFRWRTGSTSVTVAWRISAAIPSTCRCVHWIWTTPKRSSSTSRTASNWPTRPRWNFILPPVVSSRRVRLHWQGNGKPPAEILQPLVDVYKDKIPGGLMIVGEQGCIYTSHWNTNGLIRLQGEPRLKDVLHHAATKDIPETLPRVKDHGEEWLDACRGEGGVFSDFDIGGKLTEIGLAGVLGVRVGRTLEWDGAKMEAKNAPEAAKFIHSEYRTKWLS